MAGVIQFIQTTPEELRDTIGQIIDARMKKLEEKFQPKDPEQYIPREQTAKMLGISLASVHNWTKKGILQSYGMGGKIYYKRSEIENSMVKL